MWTCLGPARFRDTNINISVRPLSLVSSRSHINVLSIERRWGRTRASVCGGGLAHAAEIRLHKRTMAPPNGVPMPIVGDGAARTSPRVEGLAYMVPICNSNWIAGCIAT